MKLKLLELLELYDNWNGDVIVKDKNDGLFARVQFEKLDIWVNNCKGVMTAEVMSFGFRGNELCVRVKI